MILTIEGDRQAIVSLRQCLNIRAPDKNNWFNPQIQLVKNKREQPQQVADVQVNSPELLEFLVYDADALTYLQSKCIQLGLDLTLSQTNES